MIEAAHAVLSVRRQCRLLGLARSGLYYEAQGESAENLELMRLVDEAYTAWPFYGVRKMTAHLKREGHAVNPKRVRRLMRRMGLEAVYPKPQLSPRASGHRIYPYLPPMLPCFDATDRVLASSVPASRSLRTIWTAGDRFLPIVLPI